MTSTELVSMIGLAVGLTLASVGQRAANASTTGACSGDEQTTEIMRTVGEVTSDAAADANPYAELGMPADWRTWRVAGDLFASVERDGADYVYRDMRVREDLPVGYPAPTPAGAIELKRYPTVRRAEISGGADPREGSFSGFFPLFRHITRNDIAMTAPVEMDHHTMDASGDAVANDRGGSPTWTMSFLYETPDLGPIGIDEADPRVRIVDAPPMTVVSLGVRGWSGVDRLESGVDRLREWLDGQDVWREAGAPRTLGYNGPSMPAPRRWAEVQIPIEPAPREGVERAHGSGAASSDAG